MAYYYSATPFAAAPWERHPGRLCHTTTPRFIPITATTPGSWWPSSPPFANEDVDEPVDATTTGSWWPSSPPFANEDVDEPFADTFHEPLAEHKAENSVDWSAEFKQCFSEFRQCMREHFQQLVTTWLDAPCAEGATPTTPIYTAAANDFSHLDGEPIYDNYDDNDVIYDVFADEVTAATNFVNNAPISDDTNLIPENSNADEVSDGRICTDPSPKLTDLSPLNLGDEICYGDFICDVVGVLLFPTDDDNANLGLEQQQQCVESVLLLHDLLGPEQRAVGGAEAEQLLRDPAHLRAPHLAMAPQHAQSRLEVERFDRPDYYTVIKAIELGMAQDNLDAGRHVDFEYCDLFAAMLVDLESFMLQPEAKEKDDVPAVFVVNSAFQMWLSYDPSGMPATRSMKCLNIIALSGGVFMVTECVIFDPGTDLTLCCTGGLQPWPPPFPLEIWYGCAMIRPLPWPSFGYRIASEHLRSAATVIILPSNQCSPWQQQQQAVCQYINFNITAYKHIFLMYCIAHMLFSIVGFPWRCSYIGNFIDALCSTSKINSLRILTSVSHDDWIVSYRVDGCFEFLVKGTEWHASLIPWPLSRTHTGSSSEVVIILLVFGFGTLCRLPALWPACKYHHLRCTGDSGMDGSFLSGHSRRIWKPPWLWGSGYLFHQSCLAVAARQCMILCLQLWKSSFKLWKSSFLRPLSFQFAFISVSICFASRTFGASAGLKSSTTHKRAKVQKYDLQGGHDEIRASDITNKPFLFAATQGSIGTALIEFLPIDGIYQRKRLVMHFFCLPRTSLVDCWTGSELLIQIQLAVMKTLLSSGILWHDIHGVQIHVCDIAERQRDCGFCGHYSMQLLVTSDKDAEFKTHIWWFQHVLHPDGNPNPWPFFTIDKDLSAYEFFRSWKPP